MNERVIQLRNDAVKSNAVMVIRNLPVDGSMEIAIRPLRKVRSQSQNALMWGARLKDIATQAWVNGRQFSEDIWHEYLKEKFLPDGSESNLVELVKDADKYHKWDFKPDGGMKLVGSTTQLTTKGMMLYMTQCEAFAAQELGVMFSARGRPIVKLEMEN